MIHDYRVHCERIATHGNIYYIFTFADHWKNEYAKRTEMKADFDSSKGEQTQKECRMSYSVWMLLLLFRLRRFRCLAVLRIWNVD